MESIRYEWKCESASHFFEMAFVPGTNGRPFLFGEAPHAREIELQDFFMMTVPATQALWEHVMGEGSVPSCHRGNELPLENVSWDDLQRDGGFIDRLNASRIRDEIASRVPSGATMRFRLPTETEWEYAARGGSRWPDQFFFGGGNDIDAAAWFKDNSDDHTHEVGLKTANPLGLYDTSGNVWEWCLDHYTPNVEEIPSDGSLFVSEDPRRILRGGCFHNWKIHCTSFKRYEIESQYGDGCIGFRLVFSSRSF